MSLRKGKAYLLFGEVNGVLIQCSNDRGYKTVGSGIAGFQLGADLPLDGLAVSLRVDVWLFEKAKRYILGVQVYTSRMICAVGYIARMLRTCRSMFCCGVEMRQ